MGQHLSCCYRAPETNEELIRFAAFSDSPAALFYSNNHTKLLPVLKDLYSRFLRKDSNSISKIELKDTELSELDCISLSKLIPELKNLSELILINNSLGVSGMNYLTDHTSTMTNLETLVLSSNKINDQCMEMICPTLPFIGNLKVVNFSNNEIGDKGVELITNEIGSLSNLEVMDFRHNQAGVSSLLALANELKKIESFRSFKVSGNKLNEKDLRKINRLFPENDVEDS